MSIAIGSFTYNNVIGSVRMKLKQFTDEHYPKPTIKDDIYRAICELSALTGIASDPTYREQQVIPVTKGVVSNDSAEVTYTESPTPKTLKVPLASTNADNYWIGDTDGFDSSWIGASVRLTFDDGGSTFETTIASITDATHVVLTDEVPDELKTVPIFASTIIVSNTTTTNLIDISSLNAYKYIDRITEIEDSVNGPCIEVPEKDFRAIKHYTSAENDYRDSVIWYRSGIFIYFCKNSLSSYGVRTMFYTRFPLKPAAYTDYVDFPDTQNKMLIDVVVTGILQSLNMQLPQDLQAVATKLAGLRGSINEERKSAEANIKTQ